MTRKISADALVPGFCLPGALRDDTGRVLIPAGVELTAASIRQLGKRLLTGLYAGDDWPEDAAADAGMADGAAPPAAAAEPEWAKGVHDAGHDPTAAETAADAALSRDGAISVDLLYVNMQLSREIYSADGILLLSAGTRVTPRFLSLLQARDIRNVHLQPPKRAAEAAFDPRMAELDRQIEQAMQGRSASPDEGEVRRRRRLALEDLHAEARAGLEHHAHTAGLLADVCGSSRTLTDAGQREVEGAVHDFFDMLTLDCDLLVTVVSMKRTFGEYLFDHSVNVAMLSMTIADQFGLPREQILQLGLGALFLDVGMLRVPGSIRLAERRLSPAERSEVMRHPMYTLDYLERKTQLPPAVRFIGYQAHERSDGSGYPRGRRTIGIHPFARIVAIADIYSAMVRDRPYREAVVPHTAVKELLFEGQARQLERPLIRAMLDRLSVFPVGSLVELAGGVRARVIRATPGQHTRPVVQPLDSGGQLAGDPVDLAREHDVRVTRALSTAETVSAG